MLLTSGLIPDAPDLGSASHPELQRPEVPIAVGSGVSAYEAGEIWHDLDTRMGLPATLVERDRIESMDLTGFTHVDAVNGSTTGWGSDEEEAAASVDPRGRRAHRNQARRGVDRRAPPHERSRGP